MTENRKYSTLVDAQNYPSDPRVPLDDKFVNDNGEIINLLFSVVQSVAHIRSRAGAIRANHYHSSDNHYAYLVRGEILYFERAIGSQEIPEPVRIGPGEMFFTPPMREHCMLFTQESDLITMAKNIRDHEHHEEDVVRVSFITPEIAKKYLP